MVSSLVLFLGLYSVWAGLYVAHVARSAAPTSEAPPALHWSRAAIWLWRIAWTTIGLGFGCFGLTALRDTHGIFISVPATAPLVDQVIWVFGIVCVLGGFFLFLVWLTVLSVQNRRESREGQ